MTQNKLDPMMVENEVYIDLASLKDHVGKKESLNDVSITTAKIIKVLQDSGLTQLGMIVTMEGIDLFRKILNADWEKDPR